MYEVGGRLDHSAGNRIKREKKRGFTHNQIGESEWVYTWECMDGLKSKGGEMGKVEQLEGAGEQFGYVRKWWANKIKSGIGSRSKDKYGSSPSPGKLTAQGAPSFKGSREPVWTTKRRYLMEKDREKGDRGKFYFLILQPFTNLPHRCFATIMLTFKGRLVLSRSWRHSTLSPTKKK